MDGTDPGDGVAIADMDVQVAWRLEVAQRIGRCYEPRDPAAVTVAGSVGAALADRWSDLEVDCYWLEPPTESQRRAPIVRVGGEDAVLWDYDDADKEWSEDYRLEGLEVTISNFTVSTLEAFLDAVLEDADTDAVKHFRLAAIQRCVPLRGDALVQGWRQRTTEYPDRLVAAMVGRALTPDVLTGWAARDALIERGDEVALHALLSRLERAVISALLALNRTYEPHRVLKWQRQLLDGLVVVPRQLNSWLELMWTEDHARGLAAAEELVGDTLTLAGRHSNAQLSEFREEFAGRRRPVSDARDGP